MNQRRRGASSERPEQVEREIAMLGRAIVDLEDARDRGLLPAAGSDLVRALSGNLRRLAR